jgi:hypothetical protein
MALRCLLRATLQNGSSFIISVLTPRLPPLLEEGWIEI